MAFGRRRRAVVKWVAGQFDAAPVATAAGVQRDITLLAAADFSGAGAAGEKCYLRRVVGTIQVVPTGAIGANSIFSWAIYRSAFTPSTGVSQIVNLNNTGDFEDFRILARKDWALVVGQSSGSQSDPTNTWPMALMDWKGIAKFMENRENLILSITSNVAHTSYVRLRTLLQQPR